MPSTDQPTRAEHRARSAQVAWLLAARPEGIRADDVAEKLGKSVSTAYNLLVSLCDEGVAVHHSGGLYRLAPRFREMVTAAAAPADEPHDLSGVVDELLARTHKRAYLGVPARRRAARRRSSAARRACPSCPGSSPSIGDNAHALALGKVVLALAPPEVVERYLQAAACGASPPHTITDPRAARRAARGPPPRLRGRPRGVRRGLLLHRRAGARRPRALPRRGRDLDDAPGLRRGARGARGDPAATSPASRDRGSSAIARSRHLRNRRFLIRRRRGPSVRPRTQRA